MRFAVITDTSANLPSPWLRENDVDLAAFTYFIDGHPFQCLDTEAFNGHQFYQAIREGTRVTTSLVNVDQFTECFRRHLTRGEDVVFVSMSSGISGSCNSARVAAEHLREEFPGRQIFVVDTLSASLGEGLMAVRAAERRDQGWTAAETSAELEAMKKGMCQVFTVDDLMHLRSTGRLSNAAALIGTVLNIKPLLKGNELGQIVSFAKVRGRRRSVEAIAANYDRLVEHAADQVVGVAHADCPEDTEYLCSLLRRNNPPKDILVVDYEPVTGSHVGPGALALFFFGSDRFREEKKL